MQRICFVLSIALIVSGASLALNYDRARAQQSSSPSATPTPTSLQRTGRSYSEGEPARPPASTGPTGTSPVTFTDITARSRLTFRHAASPTSQKYLLETMGGGGALFDYDNDNRLDIFFTNGAAIRDPMPPGAMPDKHDARYWNRLYHQKPDGTFEDVTERAGVRGEGYGMGVAAGDYDADGFVDLYVTAYGGNILYRNNGDGTFTNATVRAGVAGGGWSTSAGWLDYDRDGRLDLFVARYMEWDFGIGSIYCGGTQPEQRAYCHPDNFRGATNLLFRQKPDGTFEDVSVRAGVADPEGKGLGVTFADFDGDGRIDIFVANDSVRQSLYRNKGDGTFEDIALVSGAGYDENGKTFAGMGVDAADYDNDGQPDIVITALSNETYPLFRNNGDSTFTYTTNTTGVGQITLLFTGWGTRFADFDNDGLRDIFVAQSHVLDNIERTSSYLRYRQSPLLMRNTGRGFVNISASAGAPFNTPLTARGASCGDLDNDGDMDIVIGVTDGAPVILRNDGTPHNHWIGLTLTGARSNRSGAGARITVIDTTGRRQIFDATTANSYLSASDPRILVGLGAATGVRSVEIRWPNGGTQSIANPAIERYHVITER